MLQALSSYTCGLGALSDERRHVGHFFVFAALTFVLGAAFPNYHRHTRALDRSVRWCRRDK
jgi:heme/copper-type cytochrome/quinol oxidase subunit 3